MGRGGSLTAIAAGTRLEELIKAQAYGIGFDLAGITALGPAETANAFEEWIARGYSGDMDYLSRGAGKRRDTRLPFAGARSAIVVGLNYGGTSASGPVARYARGDDYHDLTRRMLDSLHEWIDHHIGYPTAGKSYVDTGPILERDLARRAGLGWFGKNTNLINPGLGSFFFIGSLLLDLELEPDAPFEADRCGTCARCIDACPTGAIVEPRLLDATKCISYLTIEAKGAVPAELREGIGDRVYGCDICQDVCPWNVSFAREAANEAFAPREALQGDGQEVSRRMLAMSIDDFRSTFKGSPMKRAKLRGLRRDAAVALGNTGNRDDLPLLESALRDADDLVREHASWAIERINARTPA
jgi:epoxyqueuosine reductase